MKYLLLHFILLFLLCVGCTGSTFEGTLSDYSVSYNNNGSTSGTVPEDNIAYNESDKVTVLGNTGSLSKTDNEFIGWNTLPDGSGVTYIEAQTFIMDDADVVLYAKWKDISDTTYCYKVNYNGNNNLIGTIAVDSRLYKTGDAAVVQGNSGGLARSEYEFKGWNTKPDGTGAFYKAGDVINIGQEDVTLYALWSRWTRLFGSAYSQAIVFDTKQSAMIGMDNGTIITAGTFEKTSYFPVLNKTKFVIINIYDLYGNLVKKHTYEFIGNADAYSYNFTLSASGNGKSGSLLIALNSVNSSGGNFADYTVGENGYFLFNFNENGDIKWIKKIPAADAMFTALGNDSIYLILCVESDNSNYTSEGLTDTLLIKLDQSGNQLWRKQFYKEAGNMIPSAAAVDSNGNVYITGKCDRGIQYTKADGIVVEKNYISGSLNDIYILKINTGGTAIWGEIIGDVYFNSIETFVSSGIIADNEGCIIHGQTDVDYDSEIAPDNKNNTFLMSFNADGTKNWTRYISNAANVEPTISSTAFDSSGNIVITGKVKTSSTVSLFGLPRISENDSFVAKYSRSGSRMSATFFGGKGVTTNSSDVNLSSSGVIYLFGSINGSLNGEPITGDRDYFLTNFYQF